VHKLAQVERTKEMEALSTLTLLSPTGATGDTLEALQYHINELQAM
jgi:hypothetical protein